MLVINDHEMKWCRAQNLLWITNSSKQVRISVTNLLDKKQLPNPLWFSELDCFYCMKKVHSYMYIYWYIYIYHYIYHIHIYIYIICIYNIVIYTFYAFVYKCQINFFSKRLFLKSHLYFGLFKNLKTVHQQKE